MGASSKTMAAVKAIAPNSPVGLGGLNHLPTPSVDLQPSTDVESLSQPPQRSVGQPSDDSQDRAVLEELQQQLRKRLGRSSSRVETLIEQGHVILIGYVRSYYFKQLAQESALRIAGVRSVENKLQVRTAK